MWFTGNPSEGVPTSSSPRNFASHRPSPLFKFFYNFRVIFYILLEPLSNRLAFWTNRGRLLVGAWSPDWVRNIIPALQENGDMVPIGLKWRVESQDLRSGRFLGQGCSGIIYETQWSGMNSLAQKDIPGVSSDVFEDEATRLVELDHPNIVRCYCWTVSRGSCTLVMEYVRHDLYTVMQKRKEELGKAAASSSDSLLPAKLGRRAPVECDYFPFKLRDAIPILLEIAKGVEYLHGMGIIHGDLKPSNILIDLEEDPIKVKVSDFGLIESKRMTTLIPEHAFCYRMIEWSAPEMFEGYFDSRKEDLDYMWTPSLTESSDMNKASAAKSCSSEIHPLTEKADSYSFALTCAYILGGQMWNANLSPSELRKRISCKTMPERPKLPRECPETLASVIMLCWDHDPQNRLTFSEIRTKLEEILTEVSSESESVAVLTPQVPVERDRCIGSSETGTKASAAMEDEPAARSMNFAPAAVGGDPGMDIPPASDFEEGPDQQGKAVPRLNAGDEFEEVASDCHSHNPSEEFTEHRIEAVAPLTDLGKLKSVISEENEFCQSGEGSNEAARGSELDEAAKTSRGLDKAAKSSMEFDEAMSHNLSKAQSNDIGSIGVSEHACPANQQNVEIKTGKLLSMDGCDTVMEVTASDPVGTSPSSTLNENASVQQEAEMDISSDTDGADIAATSEDLISTFKKEREHDLGLLINWKSASCLNENPKLTFANALRPELRENNDVHLESNDDDRQLLLFVPFNLDVKIYSLIIKGPPEKGPKTLKLFVNKSDMNFGDVDDPATETVILTPENLEGNQSIPLKCAKFGNVRSLTVFFEDNQGNDEITRLQKLCVIGKEIETTNMKELTKKCMKETYKLMNDIDESLASQGEKR